MVEEPPAATVLLGMRCGDGCEGRIDITEALRSRPVGEWRELVAPVSDFGDAGADLGHVTAPFVITTEGTLALRIAHVRLERDVDPGD